MKQIIFNPIEEKTLNDKLVNLYGAHLVNLYTAVEPLFDNDEEVKPALPLLLELNEDEMKEGIFLYEKADVKVMVFGRENNNWNDRDEEQGRIEHNNGTYNFTLQTSDDILNEIRGKHENLLPGEKEIYGICDIYHTYCYEQTGISKAKFTKGVLRFMEQLQEKITPKKVSHVWNNLHKIGCGGEDFGKCCGEPTPKIKDIEREHFNVISEEIKILNPDVIIFMTGKNANYDNAIKDKFGLSDDAFTAIGDDIYRIDIPGIKYAARTVHPSERGKSSDYFDEHNHILIEDMMKYI